MRTSLLNLEAIGADSDYIGTAADRTPPLLETAHAWNSVSALASRITTFAESGGYFGVPKEHVPQSSMLLARPYEDEVSYPQARITKLSVLSQAGHTIMQ